ncbi:MAG: GAF domain-containing protein [Phototrophicales bacterium]|nr:GAF domain-containing protein [Phototrophicales bacterium]
MQAQPTALTKPSFNPSAIRLRLAILVVMSAITIGLFVAYLLLAITWRNQPFLGVMTNHTMTVNGGLPNGNALWNGLSAGLRAGDRILAIDNTPIRSNITPSTARFQELEDVLARRGIDETITVTFDYNVRIFPNPRSGIVTCLPVDEATSRAECQVTFRLGQFPDSDFIALFITPYLSGIFILLISFGVLYLRYKDPAAFVAVLGNLFLALFSGGLFDLATSHTLDLVSHTSGIMIGSILITLALIFPLKMGFVAKNSLFAYVPIVIGIIILAYTLISYPTNAPTSLTITAQTSGISILVGMVILVVALVFYHRRFSFTTIQRDQANVIIIGLTLATAPVGLWGITRIAQFIGGVGGLPFSVEAIMPFMITPALSVAYALIQNRFFDTERAISAGITYTILLVALMIGYMLLVLGATLLANEIIRPDNPFVIIAVVFFIAVLFTPVRNFLQRRIDAIYYRTRRDYQTKLEGFSQKLTTLSDADVMLNEYKQTVDDVLSPVNNFVFLYNAIAKSYTAFGNPPETDIYFGENSGIKDVLQNKDTLIYLESSRPYPTELRIDKPRLDILQTLVISALTGNERLNGFLCIGTPRSGIGAYTYEQLRFINSLSAQLAIGVERANVIRSLERRVRELDVLGQVSQAINYSISLDDLLELVSAQIDKLFESPYFYVVLFDPSQEQLYYAFFLENETRYEQYENRNWQIGNDLYTEIIRTAQARLIEDYGAIMRRYSYAFHNENAKMRGWMAVPLSAGQRTLGLLAVGDPNPEHRYNQEQLKIFGDVGALSATALERTRLFIETNMRARQLAALNDISRQLVAIESDIEKLLHLITTSAVDILNAEAGSLLLVVEDGSGDLEFKVVIGGTGQELIGKRLEAGFGLVGRVAKTGKPVISNDTSQDKGWQGEVTEGNFRTQSILAVPLVAKDTIIGVLEVINKKDGTSYIQEDVELLTTFASQAAVAFENARLYQQTDLQLTQRLQELETLEKIDRELNRTLDLYSVAEITVRYAVENSNATAGVLGVVDDKQTHLRIVAKLGYGEDSVPEGADGNYWPLDRGIVKRVMRTRRPDLVPNINIDRDYIPSLRGGMSQITVPLMTENDVNAILILETDQEPRLNLLDQYWVQRLAEHASIAITNAQLYDELTRANDNKSEFVGFAAHELKNPLTSVKGYASTLSGSMVDMLNADQIRNFATIIHSNAERMQGIIDDLRDIAAIDAGKFKINPEGMSLRAAVLDALITIQDQITAKGQIIDNQIDESLPSVLGDNKRIIQVMTNFISNAYKYSPPGATITIHAKPDKRYISRKGQFVGEVMIISITDTGIGMSDDDLKKIFRVDYFRSENELALQEKGTGLGMMITKRIIDGHGGEVWVESELGKGSTFAFVIPLAPQQQPLQGAPASD